MDWALALETLGGGPGAAMVLGLGWLFSNERGRNEKLTAMLMDRKEDEIKTGERREIATQQALEAVTDLIKEYARSK